MPAHFPRTLREVRSAPRFPLGLEMCEYLLNRRLRKRVGACCANRGLMGS